MKFLTIQILAFLFCIPTLYAQQIPTSLRVDDLLKIRNMNSDDIESYVAKKNLEIESTEEPDQYCLEDIKFRHEILSRFKFRFIRFRDDSKAFTIGFASFKLFDIQKSRVIALGYKLTKTSIEEHPKETSIKVKVMTYIKGSLKFSFYNFLNKELYNGLPYEITLTSQ